MGWLDTVLDVAGLAMDVANYNKLNQLKQQQGQTAQYTQYIEALLREMRNEVFRFHQAAEEILAREDDSPRVAAAAIALLEIRLQASPLSPDLFIELGDKNYVASTFRQIHESKRRLFNQLSHEEQAEVNQIAAKSIAMEDADYYIDHYHSAQQLREAQMTVTELAGRNSGLAKNGLGCGYALVAFIFVGLAFIASPGLGIFIMLAVLAGAIFLATWLGSGRYNAAVKTVSQLESSIDLERMNQLDSKYQGDLEKSRRDQAKLEQEIKAFMVIRPTDARQTLPAQTLPALPPPTDTPRPAEAELEAPQAIRLVEDRPSQPVMSYMDCPHCGSPLPEWAKRCGNCGEIIVRAKVPTPTFASPQKVSIQVTLTPPERTETVLAVKPETQVVEAGIARGPVKEFLFCPTCGKAFPSEATFCPHCGFRIV
jgi:hypothetical protein